MDCQKNLISIIVPVYNVEKYLKHCLDSLVNQRYKNIEVIMIDDGSEDKSRDICDEYADRYSNFISVHKQNAGLGLARNTGLEYVQGEFVAFVDSDDWIEPDMFVNLYNALMANGVDFCKCGFNRVTDAGKVLKKVQYKETLFVQCQARERLVPRMVGSSPTAHDSIEMCVWGCLYKTAIIKKYNILFPSERIIISEDLPFNIEYLQHANGALLISNCEYIYRYNDNSLTSKYRSDRFEAIIYFYYEIKKNLCLLGYDYKTIQRLQRLFFVYLRMCISQESKHISHLKYSDSIKNIEKMCLDETVKSIIGKYPIECLEIKQKIFVMLINKRCVHILKFLSDYGII